MERSSKNDLVPGDHDNAGGMRHVWYACKNSVWLIFCLLPSTILYLHLHVKIRFYKINFLF